MTRALPLVLALLATLLPACRGPGEDPAPAAPAGAMEAMGPEAMAEMMRLAQPGPEHEELARYAGEWTTTTSIFMAPGAEPMTQTATSSSRMILGGRFLLSESSGAFMGQSFEAMGLLGFDRRNQVWTTVGFDTLGTYWVSASGVREEDGVLRLHGTDSAPTGDQTYWFEWDFEGPDAFVVSVWFTEQGPTVYDPPFKMVETRYTRAP